MKKNILLSLFICCQLMTLAQIESSDYNSFIDERDGKVYKTVKIGNQVWMAENLNYLTKDGSECYQNRKKYAEILGRLYNYVAAEEACPCGWHLPNKNEWDSLVAYYGNIGSACDSLMPKDGWILKFGSGYEVPEYVSGFHAVNIK